MKSVLLTTLVVLIISIAAEARHRTPRNDDVDLANDFDDDDESTRERVLKHREHRTDQLKNRRRRWQSGYGYDYPAPYYPEYYPPRRNENRQENLLPEILRLLDDIAEYVKRPPPPPPPPQPIYVPYPVPYPVPQACLCRRPTPTSSNVTDPLSNVNVSLRWPQMEDSRQNWGFVTSDTEPKEEDYIDDSVRPVEFAPMPANQAQTRTPPTVNRQTSQSGSSQAAQPSSTRRRTSLTGPCDAATLSCCKPSEVSSSQAACFNNFGCSRVYRNGEACSRKNIQEVLDRYSQAYTSS